jgi:hypothetical protein
VLGWSAAKSVWAWSTARYSEATEGCWPAFLLVLMVGFFTMLTKATLYASCHDPAGVATGTARSSPAVGELTLNQWRRAGSGY